MKIYADEMPKSCNNCELGYFYDCQYCSLRPDLAAEDIWVEKEKHCPLLSTQSLKQQVRAEVVEEIRFEIDTTTHLSGQAILYDKVNRILDQAKGEANVKD